MSFNFGCGGSAQKNLKQEITTQCFRNLFARIHCSLSRRWWRAFFLVFAVATELKRSLHVCHTQSGVARREQNLFILRLEWRRLLADCKKNFSQIIVKIFYAVNWHWYWKLLHAARARCNELINLLSAVRQILNCSSDASCCGHLLSCLLKSRRH